MTTFRAAPGVRDRIRPRDSNRTPATVADLVTAVVAPPLPFRFTAYDGSSAGPADAPLGLHIATPRALTYVLTAPGDLGLARAYVAGDLTFSGVTPGDPYPMLRAMADGMHLIRPAVGELRELLHSVGWRILRPVPPPPEEAPPRWRRAVDGLRPVRRHSRGRDADSISRHYDISNAFYEHTLGPSMAYTCAVYATPETSLAEAQAAKFQLVFDKLGLQPGQRLLDVGCGWGSMVRHAARRGVRALGVTLSSQQAAWAQRAIRDEGLQDLAEVRFCDYRDVADGGFDAVSSIGLTEHIGVAHYPAYFRSLYGRLRPGGRLLNHCITRPENTSAFRTEAFIDRYVFPDGELTGSGRIISTVQDVGFEVRGSENLREHYGLTLRDWCANLERNWDGCVAEVGEGTARAWGLYMAASRLGFERNQIQLHQVLAVRPHPDGSAGVPLRPWW
jgi:cyclopropane-fatty-acyl-phospholipid synthase